MNHYYITTYVGGVKDSRKIKADKVEFNNASILFYTIKVIENENVYAKTKVKTLKCVYPAESTVIDKIFYDV